MRIEKFSEAFQNEKLERNQRGLHTLFGTYSAMRAYNENCSGHYTPYTTRTSFLC